VKFEWDEDKRLTNIQKHGIDFVDNPQIFDDDTIIYEDTRFDYGETRLIATGMLKGRVIVLAYTERGEPIRIISARKATKYEKNNYFQQIAD
jgi:uncharacterized DUF497 family protein